MNMILCYLISIFIELHTLPVKFCLVVLHNLLYFIETENANHVHCCATGWMEPTTKAKQQKKDKNKTTNDWGENSADRNVEWGEAQMYEL